MRPANTASLRLLMRLLLLRWRTASGGQGVDPDHWLGDGDVMADEWADLLALATPPADLLPQALAAAFVAMVTLIIT